MKTILVYIFAITSVISIVEACHYIRRRRSNITRKKRQSEGGELEEFEIESIVWRLYFAECMASQIGLNPKYDWATNVDYVVLNSIWYLETDQISCSQSVNEDTAECWKFFLSNFIDSDSPFLEIGFFCIDAFQNSTSLDPPEFTFQLPSRKKRQVSNTNQTEIVTEERGRYTNCIQESTDESMGFSATQTNTRPEERNRLKLDLLANFIEDHTLSNTEVCNPRPGAKRMRAPRWQFRFEALTRPDSSLRNNIGRCNRRFLPAGNFWSNWSPFSKCPVTCGTGMRVRSRTCRSGTDDGAQLSESECQGRATEMRECERTCANVWSSWRETDSCTVSCGGGTVTRRRECLLGSDNKVRLHRSQCKGNGLDTVPCNVQTCPIPDYWSNWAHWSSCSVTCGTGGQYRKRTCLSGVKPLTEGSGCNGKAEEMRNCAPGPENCHGEWQSWGSWGQCEQTCQRIRHRQCSLRGTCVGQNHQREQCSYGNCSARGTVALWGGWSHYGRCANRMQTRIRRCILLTPTATAVDSYVCTKIYKNNGLQMRRC